MAAVAYTLQVDDVSITNGAEITGYRLIEARFPAPKERGDLASAKDVGGLIDEADAHLPAERVLIFDALGTDERTAAAAVNSVVVAASRRGAKLRFRASATSELLECEIRRVEVSEDSFEPLKRKRGKIRVTLVLVTSPYWIGEEIVALNAVVTGQLPAFVDVNDVRGEVPALTRATITFPQAVTAIYVGLRSAATAAVLALLGALVQEYSGTATSYMTGGGAKTGNLSAVPTTIGSPPSLDVSLFRGLYLVVARLKHEAAAAASTLYNAISSVLASGMTGTASETTDQTPATVVGATANALVEVTALGLAAVPAGAVPDSDQSSGYAAESTSLNNAAGASLIDVDTGIFRVQSEPTSRHKGATWKLKNGSAGSVDVRALLYRAVAGVPTGSSLASADATLAAGFDAIVRFTWSVDISADSYAVVVQPVSGVAVAGLQAYGATGGTNYAGQKIGGSWVSGIYGAASTTITQNAYNETAQLDAGFNQTTGEAWAEYADQTFTASGRVQSVSVWAGASYGGGVAAPVWQLRSPAGAVLASGTIPSGAVAQRTITVDTSDYAGQVLTIRVFSPDYQTTYTTLHRNTASVYAGGAFDWGGDLRFTVSERVKQNANLYLQTFVELPLGFTASVGVQAACSEATKTSTLDNVALIPVDEGAVVVKYTAATTAGEGIMIDNLPARRGSRNVYAASASGGRGLSQVGRSTLYGALMLKPRSNRIVIQAYTPNNASPSTATVTVTYRPRYLNAASGR